MTQFFHLDVAQTTPGLELTHMTFSTSFVRALLRTHLSSMREGKNET